MTETKTALLNSERMRFGHRWTEEELRSLMQLWDKGIPVLEIAATLKTTEHAIGHMVTRLRRQGIPLTQRTKGRSIGNGKRSGELWTQGEVEYLVARRRDRATQEEIAHELGRSWSAVAGMIQRLRSLGLKVPRFGGGLRRLYDINGLRLTYGTTQQFNKDETSYEIN